MPSLHRSSTHRSDSSTTMPALFVHSSSTPSGRRHWLEIINIPSAGDLMQEISTIPLGAPADELDDHAVTGGDRTLERDVNRLAVNVDRLPGRLGETVVQAPRHEQHPVS